jgi:hypothetical protein
MAKAKEAAAGVPALVVTPERAPVVSGNFEQIETYLQKWRTRISRMAMTESNMEQVRLIKKEAGAYRNSLTRIQTEIKKTYFNEPKSVFESKMGRLLGIVGEVETAADRVLVVEENERVAGINEIIDHYVEKFQEKYGLDEERLARIERRKSYYNKTAEEKARKDDLEQQFKDLKKEQDACAANIRLIEATCKDEPRLNTQLWIDQLQYTDVANIIESIALEKQRFRELDSRETAEGREGKPEADAGFAETGVGFGFSDDGVEDADIADEEDGGVDPETGTVKIGVPCHIDFGSDFIDRTKTMKVELVYPCDLGDALTQLFAELRQYGIKVRPVKKAEDVF